jgi:DNA ligase (NAD+)
VEDFQNLYEVGEETAKAVITFFSQKKDFIRDLLSVFELSFVATTYTEGKFKGNKFCITGSFEKFSRDDIIKLIEENGGEFVSAISKNTDYLVA